MMQSLECFEVPGIYKVSQRQFQVLFRISASKDLRASQIGEQIPVSALHDSKRRRAISCD